MTRFVTGGAGFIGANFLFYLRERYPDDRLVCIDKLTYAGNLSTLAPLLGQPNFRFAKVDICDREAVCALFAEERPDVVINFAAESHVDRSIADPSLFLQTNIIGTDNVLHAAIDAGVERVVCLSTDKAAYPINAMGIRSAPTRSTATCRSTGRSCCSPSRRRCTRARPTAAPRPRLTCSWARTDAPTVCRSRSRAARITTGRISFRKSSSRS